MSPNHVFKRVVFALSLCAPCVSALSAPIDVANELRQEGCGSRNTPFQSNRKLNNAAEQFNRGAAVRDALKRAGYHAEQSASIRITGQADDPQLLTMLHTYCKTLSDPALVDIGIARDRGAIAFLFAAPFAPPSTARMPQVTREVLARVNEARAHSRRCGSKSFKATIPLTWNNKLAQAALIQAKDMARYDHVEHEGHDGSSPGDRTTRVGYVWKVVGENVAAGQLSAKEVVNGWLNSPHHCANIMDPDFTEMGAAFAIDDSHDMGIYWAQVFGHPR